MQQTRAFLKDISQLIIGIVVEESDTHIQLKNPALIATRSAQAGQFQIDFIPLEIQTLHPNLIPLRVMLKEQIDIVMNFKKEDLLMDNIPLMDNIVQNYLNTPFNKTPEPVKHETIKLY